MMFKIIVFINCCVFVLSKYYCSDEATLNLLKQPSYEFSVRILDKVSHETGGHFVFSPISPWLQLISLAEGAKGTTHTEIWKVTRHHRMACFRRKLRDILNVMDDELRLITNRTSVIIVDELFDVKDTFKKEVERDHNVKVLELNFNDPVSAAAEANALIEAKMDGAITEVVYPNDFNFTVLLVVDAAYFRGDWKYPFNRVYTKLEQFYSEEGKELDYVKMMNQIAYFNLVEVPLINAKVLELPCSPDERVSMLVFMPTKGSVDDIFFSLNAIRIRTILNLYRRKEMQLVNVKLPRFKIISDVDSLPELVFDMGVKRLFYPDSADLKGISDYKMYASLMSQIADIEVTEEGVTANFVAEFIISSKNVSEFIANKPFAFLIVDKKTEIILFAGSYKQPSVY